MNTTRPGILYLFLFAMALTIWGLQQPERLVLILLSLTLPLISYRFPGHLHFSPFMLRLVIVALFAFSTFVLHADEKMVYVSIYNSQVIQPICSGLILITILQWFLPRSERFDWLLFSVVLLFVFSSISWEVARYRQWYLILALNFIVMMALLPISLNWRAMARQPRFPWFNHSMHLLATLLLFAGVGFVLLKSAEYLEGKVLRFLNDTFFSPRNQTLSGFSTVTHLTSNMQVELSERMVMLVDSPKPFHHLRGKVLTVYNRGRWWPIDNPAKAWAYQGQWPPQWQEKTEDLTFFSLHHPRSTLKGLTWIAHFRYMGYYEGHVFIPNSTWLLGTSSKFVNQDQYGIVHQNQFQSFPVYVLAGGSEPYLPTPYQIHKELPENLQIPLDIRTQVRALALQVTHGAVGNQAKARRIENWFHQNFQYSLNTPAVAIGVDPVVDFIRHRKPGFCSWFASGMTLMLRAVGVPAHLVSGWYGMEYNDLAKVWVVREKHAHDWVEVWDEGKKQWDTYDPTPPNALRDAMGISGTSPWWHTLRDWVILNWKGLTQSTFKTTLEEKLYLLRDFALKLLRTPWFYAVLVFMVLLNFLLKRQNGSLAGDDSNLNGNEQAYLQGEPTLQPLIAHLVQYLSEQGLTLKPSDTWSDIQAIILEQPWSDPDKERLISSINRILALRFGPWNPAERDALQQDLAQLPHRVKAAGRTQLNAGDA